MQKALELAEQLKNEIRVINKSSDANTIIHGLNAVTILMERLEKRLEKLLKTEGCNGRRDPETAI